MKFTSEDLITLEGRERSKYYWIAVIMQKLLKKHIIPNGRFYDISLRVNGKKTDLTFLDELIELVNLSKEDAAKNAKNTVVAGILGELKSNLMFEFEHVKSEIKRFETKQLTNISEYGDLVPLSDLPRGALFLHNNVLVLKTDYGNNEGAIDCYIVGSGEYFNVKSNDMLVKQVIIDKYV